MNRVRKILVPVNFTEDSANGLKYAASLAEETQAELVVSVMSAQDNLKAFKRARSLELSGE